MTIQTPARPTHVWIPDDLRILDAATRRVVAPPTVLRAMSTPPGAIALTWSTQPAVV